MKLETSLTYVALASLSIACSSGSTQIGESGTGEGGSAGSTSAGMGGSSAGGMGSGGAATNGNMGGSANGGSASGGSANDGGSSASTTGSAMGGSASGGNGGVGTNLCEGRPCGASCSSCDVANMNCTPEEGEWFCDAMGQCVESPPTCAPESCDTAMDCTPSGAPCRECVDGSIVCPLVDCVDGACVGSFPTCATTTCTTDSDCPESLAPCQLCEDGTASCPWARCENGICENGIDTCGDDPCGGKQCGDDCSACDPASPVCNMVLMYCDEDLQCQPNQPMCGALSCESDDECPLVDGCQPCADGTTCAELQCVNGACQFQCPEDGMCSGDGESCAGGASCCSGLVCCAGVPVPEGEEYCSANDCPDSDVNIKRDFASVDQELVLERLAKLPIATWSYKTEAPVKHIGPMAQDFMAAFDVGASDRAIAKVDADGVAFAAIQALYGRLQALEAKNARLEQELSKRNDCAGSQDFGR